MQNMRGAGTYAADILVIASKSFRCAMGHQVLIMRKANLILLEVCANPAN